MAHRTSTIKHAQAIKIQEIEYKLQSNNPVLISHAISTLFEVLSRFDTSDSSKEAKFKESFEYNMLIDQCHNDNTKVAMSAAGALVALAESSKISIKSLICTLLSLAPLSSQNHTVVIAISQLLLLEAKISVESGTYRCPYTIRSVSENHPFLTLMESGVPWNIVFKEIQFIADYVEEDMKEISLEILNPVFVRLLCDPFENKIIILDYYRQQLWEFLVKNKRSKKWQLKVLTWMRVKGIPKTIKEDYNNINNKMVTMLDLTSIKDKDFKTVMILRIISMTKLLLEHGCDPRTNFNIISCMLNDIDKSVGNIIIGLMSEIILVCPALYLLDVMNICKMIICTYNCNSFILNSLSASLLKWMAYPSAFYSKTLKIADTLINEINHKTSNENTLLEESNIHISEEYLNLCYSDFDVQFYFELSTTLNSLTGKDIIIWLKHIQKAPIDIRDRFKLVLCGIFLNSKNADIIILSCNILVQIAKDRSFDFASHMLSLLLHKLTKTKDHEVLKILLFSLPELITVKENVAIIINTMETLLKSDRNLKYLAIELYLRAMNKESTKCYQLVSDAIIQLLKTNKSWYAQAVCAHAIKSICIMHPGRGKDLVPLINHILNKSTDVNGGTATALVIDSISILCESMVIDFPSTWKILTSKINKEKRRIVLESLCNFLGKVPSYLTENDKKLIRDIMQKLWNYVLFCNDVKIKESALKALKLFNFELHTPNSLPSNFFDVEKQSNESNVTNTGKNMSNECWIKMLKIIHKSVISYAGDLLIGFIESEVNQFRSNIYNWPRGEPPNFKYLSEKSIIRAVGEFLRKSKPGQHEDTVIVECLRIFSYNYSKALPNVNWDFLSTLSDISNEAKKYCLFISCRHASISSSAKSLTVDYLNTYKNEIDLRDILETQHFLVIYSNLEYVCSANIDSNELRIFLEATLNYALENIDIHNSNNAFECIMSAYASTLRNSSILGKKRSLLVNILKQLMCKIDLQKECYKSYFLVIAELIPLEKKDLISHILDWNSNQIKNAIIIINNDIPDLTLTIDIIQATRSIPELQIFLLKTIQPIQYEATSEVSIENWITELIVLINDNIDEFDKENNLLNLCCDFLFVSIIRLSGIDNLLLKKDTLSTCNGIKYRLLPLAFAVLVEKLAWQKKVSMIIKFLMKLLKSSLPSDYKLAFYRSLIVLRNTHEYTLHLNEILSEYD